MNANVQQVAKSQSNSLFNMTGLQGYITCTKAELINAFGEPQMLTQEESDGKVTTQWRLIFSGEVIASIYDWKNEGRAPQMNEVFEWNIGGRGKLGVQLVTAAIEEARAAK